MYISNTPRKKKQELNKRFWQGIIVGFKDKN